MKIRANFDRPSDAGRPVNPGPDAKGAMAGEALKASASPPRVRRAAHTNACSPQDLSIAIHPQISPAMGTDYVVLDVRNAGSGECALRDGALTGLRWGHGHHPKAPVATEDQAPVIHPGASQKYRLGFPSSSLTSPDRPGIAPTEATMGGQRVPVTRGGVPASLVGCDADDVYALGVTVGSRASS